MKLTKTQKAYLQSAAINPRGVTYIPYPTWEKLADLGLITKGYSGFKITDLGRQALREVAE
jgi:hypothetical protein